MHLRALYNIRFPCLLGQKGSTRHSVYDVLLWMAYHLHFFRTIERKSQVLKHKTALLDFSLAETEHTMQSALH